MELATLLDCSLVAAAAVGSTVAPVAVVAPLPVPAASAYAAALAPPEPGDTATATTVAAEKELMAEIMSSVAAACMFAPPDSDDDDDGAPPPLTAAALLAAVSEGRLASAGSSSAASPLNPSYWARFRADTRAAAAAAAHIDTGVAAVADAVAPDDLHEAICEDGFAVTGLPVPAASRTAAATVSSSIALLAAAGYPPAFVFMLDDVWQLVARGWQAASHALGSDCLLEPSIYAWALTREVLAERGRQTSAAVGRSARGGMGSCGAGVPPLDDGGALGRGDGPSSSSSSGSDSTTADHLVTPSAVAAMGAAFTLPHRDYRYDECWSAAGVPTLLNVWMPVTPSTLRNGCMRVLPRQFDARFDQPTHPDHLKAALPAAAPPSSATLGEADDAWKRELRLRFDVGAARSLPAPAGAVLMWTGNTVHWGGRCEGESQSGVRRRRRGHAGAGGGAAASAVVAGERGVAGGGAADPPRQSIAFAVRSADAGRSHLEQEMAAMTWSDVFELASEGHGLPHWRCRLDTPTRLRLVVKGLLLFKWWFGDSVPEAALPAELWAGLRAAL